MADPAKRAQMHGLALAIASAFLIPPAAVIIEAALLFCWSVWRKYFRFKGTVSWGKSSAGKELRELAAFTG